MRTGSMILGLCSAVVGWVGMVMADEPGMVGTFLAVQGTVTMQPASLTAPQAVRAYDRLGPLSIIETKAASKTKVLFADDTLITLGENSRLEMTEQNYLTGGDMRAFVAHLTRGTARVLVARSFPGDNSVFEVHSRTAVVTVRGTYFVMWIEPPPTGVPGKDRTSRSRAPILPDAASDDEGATGLANIGSSGDIAFTSGGATVLVFPGQSSIALPGGPPSMPVPIDTEVLTTGPVAAAVTGTTLFEGPKPESPRTALAMVGMGGDESSLGPSAAAVGAVGGQFPAGGYAVPGWPLPVTPVTPPAVVSGAAIVDIPQRFVITVP